MLNDLRDTFGYKIPELFPKFKSPLNLVTSCPCEFWFDGKDASTFTLNGVNVIQWDDKSGFARHVTQAIDGQRPSYNVATGRVDFVAANSDYLRSAAFDAPLTQPNTIFILYKITGVLGDDEGAFDGMTGLEQMIYFSGDRFRLYAGGALMSTLFTNANDNIHMAGFNGVSSNYWINGINAGAADAGTNTLDGITLGARGSLTNFIDGQIMEVFGYNCVITDAERNALNAYLTSRWSL